MEDREAFKEGRPYVVGYEPHSVLPQARLARGRAKNLRLGQASDGALDGLE